MKELDKTPSEIYICSVLLRDKKMRVLASIPDSSFPLTIEVTTGQGRRRYKVNLYRRSGRFKSMTLT